MTNNSSNWVKGLQDQLRRSKHVILHGNVNDQALYNGKLLNFNEALDQALTDMGFKVRASYNPVDGLYFTSPKGDTMFVKPDPSVAPPHASYVNPNSTAPNVPGAKKIDKDDTPKKPRAPYMQPLDQALPAIRTALRENNDELSSAIIYFSDRILPLSEHQSAQEMAYSVHINLIAAEASCKYGKKNTLILVAANINAVPMCIYANNPNFSLVHVTPPDAGERADYYDSFYSFFYRNPPFEEPRPNNREEFTALTDNMSYADLNALRDTSVTDQLPIQEVRRLIHYFRYGIKEDIWQQKNARWVKDAASYMSKKIVGQQKAIDAVCNVLRHASSGITVESSENTRPKGNLLLVGSTGVGKTETAKALAELVFRDSQTMLRLDMSEFKEEHAAIRLVGAPPSYVGYSSEGGQLTGWVHKHHASVILVDEFEKAHPSVFDKFLQILDAGVLTDGAGRTCHFDQTLIIFTSNIGATVIQRNPDGTETRIPAIPPGTSYEEIKAHYTKAVKEFFIGINRVELLGRLGLENIIVYDNMRQEFIPQILGNFREAVSASSKEKQNLEIRYDNSIQTLCTDICTNPENSLVGYRSVKAFAEGKLIPAIEKKVFEDNFVPGTLTLRADAGRVTAE